jgi:hypothetical protein
MLANLSMDVKEKMKVEKAKCFEEEKVRVCLCVSRLRNSYFSVTQKSATVV